MAGKAGQIRPDRELIRQPGYSQETLAADKRTLTGKVRQSQCRANRSRFLSGNFCNYAKSTGAKFSALSPLQAYYAFRDRLPDMVIDVAYTLQGNTPDELPEYLLACCRTVHVNWQLPRPFSQLAVPASDASPPTALPLSPYADVSRQQQQ